jgi:hypothetical protein
VSTSPLLPPFPCRPREEHIHGGGGEPLVVASSSPPLRAADEVNPEVARSSVRAQGDPTVARLGRCSSLMPAEEARRRSGSVVATVVGDCNCKCLLSVGAGGMGREWTPLTIHLRQMRICLQFCTALLEVAYGGKRCWSVIMSALIPLLQKKRLCKCNQALSGFW